MHYLHYEENLRHGTEDFPLEFYAVDEQHPKYNMPLHWHRETELIYIRRGEFRLSLNGTEYCLREGELCYIPDGTVHGGEPMNCAYECIVFDAGALLRQTRLVRHSLRKVENDQTQILPFFTKEQPGILKCAARMFAAARTKQDGWEMLVLAGLYDFYGTVLRQQYYSDAPMGRSSRQRGQQIKGAIEYIETNYAHPISLDDLASTVGLSPKYFCRYFRTMTQRTPIDYLNYYRIERACYLLEQQQLTVTEIAYECGFNDISYFIRCFKKYKGITPYQYVKNLRSLEGKYIEK